MGISRLTAMEIQGNETKVGWIGPHENGKFGMAIYMVRDGDIHKSMISVDYGHFDTKEDAIQFGEKLVEDIRKAEI